MPRDAEAYIYDMLDACEFLLGFTSGRDVEDYRQDRGFRSAIERELQNIGEALMHLDHHFPELARRITNYRDIIGFRHVLVHGYSNLEPDTVWNVIENDLAILRDELKAMLADK